MVGRILTINSGSSSIKFSVYDMGAEERPMLSASIDRIGFASGSLRIQDGTGATLADQHLSAKDHAAALSVFFAWLREHTHLTAPDAVGHRVVHGGAHYTEPHVVTPEVTAVLTRLIPLAPEHLPHEIKAMETVSHLYPDVPQVASFDTAFHRRMPDVAQRYALPRQLMEQGIVRYGFHGLSYEYLLGELAREAGAEAADGRVIMAHLGNGASMAALRHGQSIDTTMGFTPTGGLVMSTRSGDLDPGVLLYLLDEQGLEATALRKLVSHQAGLLGVSGTSADMSDLLAREREDGRAAQAVALFCYQAKKYLGALVAVLGGLDTLVFTAGIGEHAVPIRARICAGMEFAGIEVDAERNAANAAVISPEHSAVTVRVMKTNEELMIARHTRDALARAGADGTS